MSRANDDRRGLAKRWTSLPEGRGHGRWSFRLDQGSERLRRAAPRVTAGVAGDAPLAAELEGLQGRPPQVLVQDAGAVLCPIGPSVAIWIAWSANARKRAATTRRGALARRMEG
jgi:hypothetical protein